MIVTKFHTWDGNFFDTYQEAMDYEKTIEEKTRMADIKDALRDLMVEYNLDQSYILDKLDPDDCADVFDVFIEFIYNHYDKIEMIMPKKNP